MSEFDRIIGYEDEKIELKRLCDILKKPDKYKKLGVTSPRGLFILGVPGIGKTLMANCLIKESGRKTFCLRKDRSNDNFVKEIKDTFERAKKEEPSIVFLDDIDKFANEDMNHKNASEYVTIQSLIDECRDFEVFVIATANEDMCIPSSLLRAGRLDKKLELENPKYSDAVKIVRYYLSQKNYVKDIDIEEVTRILNGKSCAELESIINEAGVYAGFQGKSHIDMDDMISATLRSIYHASVNLSDDKEYSLERAYHEAGHLVVSEVLKPGSVYLASIAPNDRSLGGFVKSSINCNGSKDIKKLENMVRHTLGGKAATELVFGICDVGSNSDIHSAFRYVGLFIDNYCKYDFSRFLSRDSGEVLKDSLDNAKAIEMARFYGETKEILAKNRDFLDSIAYALMEKKVLRAKDIDMIKKGLKKNILCLAS